MTKRPVFILLLGVALAVAGYFALFYGTTARQRAMMETDAPELIWLKTEFHLSDADFQRVSKLHDAYLPRCAEMCERIAVKSEELKDLLATNQNVTADIEKVLAESNQLRTECHKGMLQHFYDVSRAMPPEQGKRYLAWVQERTLLDHGGMMMNSHTAHD